MYRLVTLVVAAIAVTAGAREAKVVQTAQATNDRLSPKRNLKFAAGSSPPVAFEITVDATQRFQTMLGFGGALTDSAAITLMRLKDVNASAYDRAMDMYFGPDGLQYSFVRWPMGSCDFTYDPSWSYDMEKDDWTLSKFSIDHDRAYRLPVMKDALARRAASNATNMKVLGSPWSAPGWMKTNGHMICGLGSLFGCQLKNTTTAHSAFAYYFSKWVNAMRNEGIPVWGVTVMNEPQINFLTYEGQVFTPESERDFVRDFLGPILESTAPNTNILYLDHNKDHLAKWTPVVLGDPAAAKYFFGAAVHWYTGDHFDDLAATHAAFPNHHILATEATVVPDFKKEVTGGDWKSAEHYVHDQIGDFNNWVTGWIDWNLMLNDKGGPMHVNFLVLNSSNSDSMMLADLDKGEVYVQDMYYYMGQMSKFVPEGSVRIGWSMVNGTAPHNTSAVLETTSFITPAQDLVTVVMNRNDEGMNYTIVNQGEAVAVSSPPHSIQTLVYPAQS